MSVLTGALAFITSMTLMQANATPGGLEDLVFDNRFTRELPADPAKSNLPREVRGACFSRVQPKRVAAPELVACARDVAELIGLSDDACRSADFASLFAGNRLLPGMDPYAMCYGGHQFGHWAGQLGDGRAINLGEVVNGAGEHWILQLKGAGPTPYSRGGDGFAVLRSSLREFLCSEAMHHLGVPTTRALSLVTTGEEIVRDMFYDGNPKPEQGAIVCRVARSFTRFGSFEIFSSRGELEQLRVLADYTIRNDFPQFGAPSADVYVEWFREVCRTTADMLVHWLRVGFVHGVMNTDNMSIMGETIDYGPYGWLEDYDPGWTPNTTDAANRRYCFGNQSQVAHWNIVKLANALVPLVGEVAPLELALDFYAQTYDAGWEAMMAAKLGLNTYERETDEPLIAELLEVLQLVETDMTIFYRRLAAIDVANDQKAVGDAELIAALTEAYYVPSQLTDAVQTRIGAWLRRYLARVRRDGTSDEQRKERMNAVNPKYVLRNYLAQLAIDKAEHGDNSLVHELLELLRHPYEEQPQKEEFARKRPDWARQRPGCSMLSCSS